MGDVNTERHVDGVLPAEKDTEHLDHVGREELRHARTVSSLHRFHPSRFDETDEAVVEPR